MKRGEYMTIRLGGERQCVTLNSDVVRKISVRSWEADDFDVIDDYYEYGNQTLNEAAALEYIHSEAPKEISKFFPKLIQLRQVMTLKETYSAELLSEAGYSLHWDTSLEELREYPSARVYNEWIIDIERITPFEDFNQTYQKKFFGKKDSFTTFALYHGVSILEIAALKRWLKQNIDPKHRKMLDYNYVYSNWGINRKTGYPQILDLGYFVFKEGGEK